MKVRAFLMVTLVFVTVLFIVAVPQKVEACSGDECGCGIAANECVADCDANPNCTGACRLACATACVRENSACSRACCAPCPILVDLENDGIHLTGLSNPVWFDIDADGKLDLISWTDGGEGLLALDRNGNGTIDNGGELFGNATRFADGSRALNGYLALAELDSWGFGGNADGRIDTADATFVDLRMWTDQNHDGVSQSEELASLEEARILGISLEYKRTNRTDRYGNEFRFRSTAWEEVREGVQRPLLTWDVFLLVMP